MGFGLWRGWLRKSRGEVEGEGGSCGCTGHFSLSLRTVKRKNQRAYNGEFWVEEREREKEKKLDHHMA